MKSNYSNEVHRKAERLMDKARKQPEGSPQRSILITQVLRVYNPGHYNLIDDNTKQIEF